MHGPTMAGGPASNPAAAALKAAMARPRPLEEAKETTTQKAAEHRQAPALNPLPTSPSPEGVGTAVDRAA
jgi:hypothetical protein